MLSRIAAEAILFPSSTMHSRTLYHQLCMNITRYVRKGPSPDKLQILPVCTASFTIGIVRSNGVYHLSFVDIDSENIYYSI